MEEGNFVKSVLFEKIRLPATHLHSDYEAKLLGLLQDKVAGKCTKHGLIKIGSISIIKVASGVVELQTFKGTVCFVIKFTADVCNPMVGAILRSRVHQVNSFGILCTCSYVDGDGIQHTIMEIIVPKQSMAIQSEISLNSVKIGQFVNVEVMGKKFQLNDKKISIIGRIIKSAKGKGFIGDDGDEEAYVDDEDNDVEGDSEEGSVSGSSEDESGDDGDDGDEAVEKDGGEDVIDESEAKQEEEQVGGANDAAEVSDDAESLIDDGSFDGGDSDFEYED
jgi:DNA-directed RNA polymerase subunit E'/Rpb7